jgi:hypothetical protein
MDSFNEIMTKNTNSQEFEEQWKQIMAFFKQSIGRKPADLKGVLFLIGIQELGKGPEHFTKEQKQDLIHIATCKVLSLGGFYTLIGTDEEGWPHWELINKLPPFDLFSQENLLKHYIIQYFKTELGLHI